MVIIKDMNMPKDCKECPMRCIMSTSPTAMSAEDKNEYCPLVEVNIEKDVLDYLVKLKNISPAVYEWVKHSADWTNGGCIIPGPAVKGRAKTWDELHNELHKDVENTSDKNKALTIACDLMLGAFIYGIDSDKLFEVVMEKDGFVCADNMAEWIEENIDRFSDDEEVKDKAIERLGF